ncbi:MAG: hypothetical protein K2Q01_02070, partial [Rickettsiales bacterium]|nr:hypothetical protein [Rickettsiales bacterium]
YDFNDVLPLPKGVQSKHIGPFYDALRAGEYNDLLTHSAEKRGPSIPFMFDSGGDEVEKYRGEMNTYIRAHGHSLVQQCADALLRERNPKLPDTISRNRIFWPREADLRDMYPDQGGHVTNDAAAMRWRKLEEEREWKATENKAKNISDRR